MLKQPPRQTAFAQEGVPPVPTLRFKPGSTSARELSTLADLLVAHSPATSARQLSLTTLAAAATAALDGGVANAWDAAGREERQLLLACAGEWAGGVWEDHAVSRSNDGMPLIGLWQGF